MVDTNGEFLNLISFSQLDKWGASNIFFKQVATRFQTVELGRVLKRIKKLVIIQDNEVYKRITIRQYGLGVHIRDEIEGKNIGTKRQFAVKAGQLIISRIDARNGSMGIVPQELDEAVVTNDFWLFDVKDASAAFLLILLSSQNFQDYWQSKSNGTTNRQRVDEQDFLKTKIPLPSVEIQNRIVDKYNSMFAEAKENDKKANEIENTISKIMDDLLDIKENNSSIHEGINLANFSSISQWGVEFISKGSTVRNTKFKVRSIKSLCDVGSGGTPSRSIDKYYSGNIPWIKTGEVLNEIIFDTEEKITQEAVANSSAKLYPVGSLIIAMYGQGLTRGRTAKLGVEAATNQACAVLYNIDNSQIITDYLWLYLQCEYHRIRALASGNNQPNLNAQMIKDYPVVIPKIKSDDKDELTQEVIAKRIFGIKDKIKAYRQKAASLRELAKEEFEEAVFGEA